MSAGDRVPSAWVLGHGGIGAAIARCLAESHDVVTFDRRSFPNQRHFELDFRDREAIDDAFARAVADGAPHTVVAAFGHVSSATVDTASPDEIRSIVDHNFVALVHVLAALQRWHPLRCIVIASNAGLVARPSQPIYAATKAAIVSLVASQAVAWSASGSRIVGVAPGTVIVPRNHAGLKARFPDLPRDPTRPGGRVVEPDELARFVVTLARHADQLTGHTIPFDGGSSLG